MLARWYAPTWGPKPQLPGVMGKHWPLLPNGWTKVGVQLMGAGGGRVGAACLPTALGRMVLCMPRIELLMVLVRVAVRW